MIYNDDCLNVLPALESNSIDLVIADPPYFKTVNQKWDYQWGTEEQYLAWSLRWLTEIQRTLRYGGSLYIFGYFRTLSKLVFPLEEMGFSLRQDIILSKGIRSIAGRATKGYKQFPTTTEHCLFLIKDSKPYIKGILKQQQKKLNISSKEINRRLGVKENGGGMWSIFAGNNVCEQVPTNDMWDRLQDILEFNIDYNTIAQTFNAEMGITDIWELDFYQKGRTHPTQKPKRLMERLIRCSSNEGDTLLDPFFGSGVSILTAKELNRKYIGIERDKKYYDQLVGIL